MKRLVLCLLGVVSGIVCIAWNNPDDKQARKECETVCKQLKDEGWAMYNSRQSLEEAMLEYHRKQDEKQLASVIGSAQARTINVALRKAMNHVSVQCASSRGARVEGQVISEMQGEAADGNGGYESHSASYVTSVNEVVKPLKPEFILTRSLSNKMIEVKVYCLVKPSF